MFNMARMARRFMIGFMPLSGYIVSKKGGNVVTESTHWSLYTPKKKDIPSGVKEKINIKYNNTSRIKEILGSSRDFLYDVFVNNTKYIVIDYNKIEHISELEDTLLSIDVETTVIICNSENELENENYNDSVFNILYKFQDKMTIIYLCTNSSMHPTGNDYENDDFIHPFYLYANPSVHPTGYYENKDSTEP